MSQTKMSTYLPALLHLIFAHIINRLLRIRSLIFDRFGIQFEYMTQNPTSLPYNMSLH